MALGQRVFEADKTMKTFQEVQDIVTQLGTVGNLPIQFLTIFNQSPEDGRPHIEIEVDKYDYVISERGYEFLRKSTKSLDELLYWIFDDISSNYAFKFELRNRRPKEDSRRQAFDIKIQTLNEINPDWAAAATLKVKEILKSSPFSYELQKP